MDLNNTHVDDVSRRSSRRGILSDALFALSSTRGLERFEVRLVDIARDVIAIEARRIETRDLRVHAETRLQEVFDGLVNQTIRAEGGANFILSLVVGDEFLARRHVDAVHVGKANWRRCGGEWPADDAELARVARTGSGGRPHQRSKAMARDATQPARAPPRSRGAWRRVPRWRRPRGVEACLKARRYHADDEDCFRVVGHRHGPRR